MTYPVIGVNLTSRSTTTTGSEIPFRLGQKFIDDQNRGWMFVRAEGALSIGTVVAIDENFDAYPITKALADAGNKIGVAPAAFADEELGWVQISGIVANVLVLASCAADVALYTCATAGSIDDASASQTKINGIVLTTARAASDGVAPGNMTIEPWAV